MKEKLLRTTHYLLTFIAAVSCDDAISDNKIIQQRKIIKLQDDLEVHKPCLGVV